MATATTQRQRFAEIRVHEVTGKPPDGYKSWNEFASKMKPLPGIDHDMLYKGDDDPFHATLDILRDGVTSENGMYYGSDFNDELVKQIAGLGSKDGHSTWADTGSFTDAGDWVAVEKVGDTWYGKLRIPPGPVRENVRRIMARGGKLRTSIEVWGVPVPILDAEGKDTGTWRLSDPELEAIDMVRATAAALKKHTSGTPIYSQETIQSDKPEEPPMPVVTVQDVPEDIRKQIIAESKLQTDATRVTEELTEAKQKLTEAQTELSTLKSDAAAKDLLIKEANTALTEANQRIADAAKSQFDALLSETVGSFTASWKITSETAKSKVAALHKQFRRALLESIADERDPVKVKETAQTVWDEEFKGIAESMVSALSGGAGVVAPKSPDGKPQRLSDEDRKALKEQYATS